MNDEAGSARINALVIKAGHVGPHLLAHHMLGVAVLKIAQISSTEYDPGPASQRQVRNVVYPHPVVLGGARLGEQPVGGAA